MAGDRYDAFSEAFRTKLFTEDEVRSRIGELPPTAPAADPLDRAVDILARAVIRDLVGDHLGVGWQSYPFISEQDWYAIEHRVRRIVEHQMPTPAECEAAHALFRKRSTR